MGLDVPLRVHRHEGGELHEAGIDPSARPGVPRAGTVAIRLFSNQAIGLLVASSLTLVGLTRVSTGPAISVMLRGFCRVARPQP